MTIDGKSISPKGLIRPSTAGRLSRRLLLGTGAALFLSSLAVPWRPAAATTPEAASAFLTSIGDRAIGMLSDSAVEEAIRKENFLELLNEGFDVPRIARFIVGRYWRGTEEATRQSFIEVFEQVLVNRFLPLFSGASSDQFNVGLATESADSKNTHFVQSLIRLNSGEIVQATWRLLDKDGQFKILDIVVEGASMAITLRSEYGGVIKRDGGKLDGLIAQLRAKNQ